MATGPLLNRASSLFGVVALFTIAILGAVALRPSVLAAVRSPQAEAAEPAPAATAPAATIVEPVVAPIAPAVIAPIPAAENLSADAPRVIRPDAPLQCAIYARQRTGVSLSGAARLWWDQAEGRYPRTHQPQIGAVMAMGGTPSGHVAVVAAIRGPREILVDQANWMNQGEIMLGALVVDVSPNNDWSQVRVWHVPSNQLGLRAYPVMGFILPQPI